MDKDVIQGVIALLDEADKQIEGLTPKKANALLICNCEDAVNSLREALAEQPAQQQEPVEVTYQEAFETMQALYNGNLKQQSIAVEFGKTKLYTSPPASKPWVGLTDEEFQMIYDIGRTPVGMMELVEAKLKEKNT